MEPRVQTRDACQQQKHKIEFCIYANITMVPNAHFHAHEAPVINKKNFAHIIFSFTPGTMAQRVFAGSTINSQHRATEDSRGVFSADFSRLAVAHSFLLMAPLTMALHSNVLAWQNNVHLNDDIPLRFTSIRFLKISNNYHNNCC